MKTIITKLFIEPRFSRWRYDYARWAISPKCKIRFSPHMMVIFHCIVAEERHKKQIVQDVIDEMKKSIHTTN